MEAVLQTRERQAGALTLAFVTYSLVPYLGILFCPGAVVMGAAGCLISLRTGAGRRAAWMRLALALLSLMVQLFLWWLLYKIPVWSGARAVTEATGSPF
jgi:sorbitol-specific phosphotransferase system component IIBC